MKLIAISFDISCSAREIIENVGKNIFNQPIFIIDLKVSEPETGPTDNILIFGAKANRLFSRGANQNILLLPELKELEPGNDKTREQVYINLLDFKERIQKQKIISYDDIPKKVFSNVSWKGKTKNGKTIEIQSENKPSNADIVITFEELEAIKAAIDVLDIEEIVIE